MFDPHIRVIHRNFQILNFPVRGKSNDRRGPMIINEKSFWNIWKTKIGEKNLLPPVLRIRIRFFKTGSADLDPNPVKIEHFFSAENVFNLFQRRLLRDYYGISIVFTSESLNELH